jgi:hypothetical protein
MDDSLNTRRVLHADGDGISSTRRVLEGRKRNAHDWSRSHRRSRRDSSGSRETRQSRDSCTLPGQLISTCQDASSCSSVVFHDLAFLYIPMQPTRWTTESEATRLEQNGFAEHQRVGRQLYTHTPSQRVLPGWSVDLVYNLFIWYRADIPSNVRAITSPLYAISPEAVCSKAEAPHFTLMRSINQREADTRAKWLDNRPYCLGSADQLCTQCDMARGSHGMANVSHIYLVSFTPRLRKVTLLAPTQ